MKSHSSSQFAAMKANIIEQILKGELSVTTAAKLCKKSRVTIYDWMTKYKSGGAEALIARTTGPKSGTTWNRTRTATEHYILNLIEQEKDMNIYDLSQLLPEEHKVHPCTIWRIYERHRTRLSDPRKPRLQRKPKLYVKEYIGEEIQMDTSFPWGYGTKRVSFDCLDDCSRFAHARMYERKKPENAIAFLHYVIAKAPFVIRAIRTDRGTEFGKIFTKACQQAGIEHIRNDAYSPEQNGKVEKFHDIYKQRCFYTHLTPTASIDEHNYIIRQWLEWYNYRKTHSGLGMDRRTPAQVIYQSLTHESVKVMLQPNNN
jgi:transposase InsO family protein